MKRITFVLLIVFLQQTIFSQGNYLEYKVTPLSATGGGVGSMKSYYQNGNGRMEMSTGVSSNSSSAGSINFVGIMLEKTPNTVYVLNEKNKTYTEFATFNNEEYKDYAQNEYEVTVIGKEKVNGYNSTHIKVQVKGKKEVEEMWLSKEITDYATFSKLKTKYTGKVNLYKAMQAKGVAGFPVRVISNGRKLDLVKADKRDNPAALFSLNGYTKKEGVPGMAGSADVQEMMKKMKNMTPAQREAIIKQMKNRYGSQPKN